MVSLIFSPLFFHFHLLAQLPQCSDNTSSEIEQIPEKIEVKQKANENTDYTKSATTSIRKPLQRFILLSSLCISPGPTSTVLYGAQSEIWGKSMFLFSRRASTFAVACPGQGILPYGCLHPLLPKLEKFRNSMEIVDEALGEKFCQHLVEAPTTSLEKWSQLTSNAQPAILTSTFIIYDLFRQTHGVDLANHPKVSYLMGHSLGEYTALLLGGVISLSEAVRLVRKRGILMETLTKDKEYGMAVLMFKPADFQHVRSIAEEQGVLACINNASQILILGEFHQIERCIDFVNSPKKKILKVAKLPVTIPFHNKCLHPIEEELQKMVKNVESPSRPIMSNLTGKPAISDPFQNTLMCNSRPVLWKNSMEYLIENNVESVINLGPGNAVDSINGRFKVKNHPLKGFGDFDKLAQLLSEA